MPKIRPDARDVDTTPHLWRDLLTMLVSITTFRVPGAGSQVPTSGATADIASIVTCALLVGGAWIEATEPFP
jgi:hypothetical protein